MNLNTPEKPKPKPGPMEDAGTQALSEALASSFKLVKVIMILLVLVFLGSGIREVGSFERAIKLRFGKPLGSGEGALLEPGWHLAWPYPIDEIVRIPIGQVQEVRSTVGWYGLTVEQEALGLESRSDRELMPFWDGYLIAGDGNIFHSRATVRYSITDPVRYALEFTTASNVVLEAVNNALNGAATQFSVDSALRTNKLGFKDEVVRQLERNLVEYQIGVVVENVEIETIPPRQIKMAFDAVAVAEQDRDKIISDARGAADGVLARADGEADAIVNAAQAEATRRMQALAADARYFQDQLEYYRADPELFVARLQAERLGRIMQNVGQKQIFTEQEGGSRREIRLQVGPAPPKVAPAATGQDGNP